MKAVITQGYGGPEVLKLVELGRPVPGPREVLIEVHASTVTTMDWRLRAAAFPGVMSIPGRMVYGICAPRHKVQGAEFAGIVAEVGTMVDRFAPGDAVFGIAERGANGDFLTISQHAAIARKPDTLSFEEAAVLPFGALCALVFLRDRARLTAGQRVLIVGASGGVGSYAVQIAKAMGAEVTGVASGENLQFVHDLGAEHTVDYRVANVSQWGARFDVVFDTVGALRPSEARRLLARSGVFMPLNFGFREIFQSLAWRLTGGPRLVISVNDDTASDLEALLDVVAAGQLRPLIDRRYGLEEIGDAHRFVEARHRRGGVVILHDPLLADQVSPAG